MTPNIIYNENHTKGLELSDDEDNETYQASTHDNDNSSHKASLSNNEEVSLSNIEDVSISNNDANLEEIYELDRDNINKEVATNEEIESRDHMDDNIFDKVPVSDVEDNIPEEVGKRSTRRKAKPAWMNDYDLS